MVKKLVYSIITASLALLLAVNSALAIGNPNLTVLFLGTNNNDPSDGWIHNVRAAVGNRVQFYIEVHNTNVPTEATNTVVRVNLPQNTSSQHTVTSQVTADNAASVSDQVTVQITTPGGGRLDYIEGSAKATWDSNGDGVKELNNTPIGDDLITSGHNFGGLQGCNEFILQISFLANVVAPEQPTPTPTPTPTPPPVSPTPTPGGGQQQSQSQSQTQNNTQTQTVNVTQNITQPSPAPAVAGISELPKTGAALASFATLGSGVPVGLALRLLARRLRRRSQLEPELDPEEGSDWLELTVRKLANR